MEVLEVELKTQCIERNSHLLIKERPQIWHKLLPVGNWEVDPWKVEAALCFSFRCDVTELIEWVPRMAINVFKKEISMG